MTTNSKTCPVDNSKDLNSWELILKRPKRSQSKSTLIVKMTRKRDPGNTIDTKYIVRIKKNQNLNLIITKINLLPSDFHLVSNTTRFIN
jgi:hypothetical protein